MVDPLPINRRDIVEIVSADTITPRAVAWVWRNFIPRGKLSLFAGPPSTAKTTIAIDFAARITSAGKWPDGTQAERGSVLMWSGEDDIDDTLLPRFLIAGGDAKRMHFVRGVIEQAQRRAFDPARDVPTLTNQARRLSELKMLIVDPVVSAISGDSHKNAEVRRGMQPLVDLANEIDCALIGITHFSKGTAGRDPTERVTGSLAFGALARVVMATAKQAAPGEKRRLVRAKSNIGPDGGGFSFDLIQEPLRDYGFGAQRVVWGSQLDGDARDLLAVAEDNDGGALAEATAFLRTTLAHGTVEMSEIEKAAKADGHAWRTVIRAKKNLNVASTKDDGQRGKWKWRLPPVPTPVEEEVPF